MTTTNPFGTAADKATIDNYDAYIATCDAEIADLTADLAQARANRQNALQHRARAILSDVRPGDRLRTLEWHQGTLSEVVDTTDGRVYRIRWDDATTDLAQYDATLIAERLAEGSWKIVPST